MNITKIIIVAALLSSSFGFAMDIDPPVNVIAACNPWYKLLKDSRGLLAKAKRNLEKAQKANSKDDIKTYSDECDKHQRDVNNFYNAYALCLEKGLAAKSRNKEFPFPTR